MADISIGTLMMSIQAVNQQILRLEGLQQSEPSDAADLQDLLFTYEQTAEELKAIYIERQKFSENFPRYELLLTGNTL